MSNETLSAEELGNKLLQSVKEMKAGKAARVSRVEPNQVAEARGKTGLTQREFAEEVLHISPRTLQEWEQGRRKPSGPGALNPPEIFAPFGLICVRSKKTLRPSKSGCLPPPTK